MKFTKLWYFLFKNPFDFAAFCLGIGSSIIIFLLLSIYYRYYTAFKNINWEAIAVLIALIAVIVTLSLYHKDNKYKKSESCLKKIKENFDKTICLLHEGGNKNIKWHQAIDLLKVSDVHLKILLTNAPHKIIYITSYINTAYVILDIIKNIDSIDFFYGTDLEKSYKSHTRIAPESLKWLCVFIEEANKARFNVHNLGG